MSVLFRSVEGEGADRTIVSGGGRGRTWSTRRVRQADAMRHSVTWAAARLRADLVSLMPVDTYRKVQGVAVEVSKPSVLVTPCEIADGQPMSIDEWIYSTQVALDTTGNVVGIVKARDGLGLPTVIEPVAAEDVSFRIKGRRISEYRINGTVEKPENIWHERQYTMAGIPVGLSPIAHAASSLAAGLSAQEFAIAWFENGGVPTAIIKNTEKAIPGETAQKFKEQYRDSRNVGEPFVVGKDWEYVPMAAKAAETQFIQQMQYTDADLCRFFGVPADMVDVVLQGGGSLTYANITQRNLQLLIVNLGGAVKRREVSLSRLTPAGQFVKLNRNAVLAMDAKTRAELFKQRIDARTITPDEVRALEDEMPFTEADYAQIERLFGARTPNQPQTAGS